MSSTATCSATTTTAASSCSGKARDYLRLNPYAYPYVAEYANNDDYYFNGGKDRDKYNRYEGVINLGGFILKDRLWFFASFNPVYASTYAMRWFTSDPATHDRSGPGHHGR